MTSIKDATNLIRLSRASISSYFTDETIDKSKTSKFKTKQGVFVTLTIEGKLRGCIGFPEPVLPLQDAIIQSGRAAAFEDPRFEPLTEDEFKEVTIEISILTVPEEIKVNDPKDYPKNILIGRDGLIIRSSSGSGLLLPQVFTEYTATPQKALEMTCQKAGLAIDFWKNNPCKIFKFQTEIFKEETPGGKIIPLRT